MRKGRFGYIKSMRGKAMLQTFIFFALAFFLFFVGIYITGSNKNILSVVSAFLCLPGAMSIVRFVMFLRAAPCSKHIYDETEKRRAGLIVYYDLTMTRSEGGDFSFSALTVLENHIVCFTENRSLNEKEACDHIRAQAAIGGYDDVEISVTKELDEFLKLLDTLNDIRISKDIDPRALEESRKPGTPQTLSGIMLSISL